MTKHKTQPPACFLHKHELEITEAIIEKPPYPEFAKNKTKLEIIALLAAHERNGTLPRFIWDNASDYIGGDGEVMVFTLMQDLGL